MPQPRKALRSVCHLIRLPNQIYFARISPLSNGQTATRTGPRRSLAVTNLAVPLSNPLSTPKINTHSKCVVLCVVKSGKYVLPRMTSRRSAEVAQRSGIVSSVLDGACSVQGPARRACPATRDTEYPRKHLCGGIPCPFLEPLARSWSHFVGVYRQMLTTSLKK